MRRSSCPQDIYTWDWRKFDDQSSLWLTGWLFASGKFLAHSGTRTRLRLCSLPFVLAVTAVADASEILNFEIPRQRADLALIAFAEQADRTLLFSFDETSDKTANRLSGRYELVEALERLLAGTGLSISISEKGQLSVAERATSSEEREVKRQSILGRIGAVLASALVGSSASAEEAAAEAARNQQDVIEEIVVTARFREETANDMGLTINVLDATELARDGIENFNDIVQLTPGLDNISQGPGRNLPIIRGITSIQRNDQVPAQPSGNTMFFDEIAVTGIYPSAPELPLYDLHRVEVLKGPQPTYFGEGSMGGSIRFFSQDPSMTELEYRVRTEASSTSGGGTNYIMDASVGIPLVQDKLAVRLTGFRTDQDGFIDNDFAGASDVNTYENSGFMGVLNYEPNDWFTWRLSGFHQSADVGDRQYVSGDADDLSLVGSLVSSGAFVGYAEPFKREDEATLIASKISAQLGSVTLEYVAGYYDRKTEEDGFTPEFSFEVLPSFGIPDPTTSVDASYGDELVTHELRVLTGFNGPLNFVGGIYYADTDTELELRTDVPGFSALMLPFTTFAVTNTFISGEQISVYGEAQLSLMEDRLRIAGGARYFDQEFSVALTAPNGEGILEVPILCVFGLPACVFDADFFGVSRNVAEISEWLPRVQAEFDLTNDVLVFASASKGARNGLFNNVASLALGGVFPGTPTFDDLIAYDPDVVWTYEAGIKATLFEESVQLNVSAFYSDFQDLQALVQLPAFALTRNIGDVDIKGLDVELTWQMNDYLNLYVVGNLTRAELAQDVDLSVTAAGTFTARKGTEMPQVAPESFTIGLDGRIPGAIADYDLVGTVSYAYTGERTNQFIVGFLDQKAPSLGTMNLRFGLEGDRWSVHAFVENVTNEVEPLFYQSLFDAQYINRPRTFGLAVRFDG